MSSFVTVCGTPTNKDNNDVMLLRHRVESAVIGETHQQGWWGAILESPCILHQRMVTLDDRRKSEVVLALWQNQVPPVPSSVCQGEATLPRETTSWQKRSRRWCWCSNTYANFNVPVRRLTVSNPALENYLNRVYAWQWVLTWIHGS